MRRIAPPRPPAKPLPSRPVRKGSYAPMVSLAVVLAVAALLALAGCADHTHPPASLAAKPPPEWMTDAQRILWADTLDDVPPGALEAIDWGMFAEYIETLDRYARMVLQERDGNVSVAFVRALNETAAVAVHLAAELGLTPLGRARIAGTSH
jgi:type IV pilus biogenesis protein CpaD/CtpE